jgi:hypothetical protein
MLRARSLFRIVPLTLVGVLALSGAMGVGATTLGAAAVVEASLIRLGQREAERDVRAESGVLEKNQTKECISGSPVPGERVGLACQSAEAVAHRPVQAVAMDGLGQICLLADHGPDLDPLDPRDRPEALVDVVF